MKRIWLDSYPEGVPHDIDMSEYDSVLDIFKRSCAKYGDRPAYSSFNQKITFSQVEQLTEQFACFLQKDLGLKKLSLIHI